MAEKENLDIPMILTIGIVSVVLTVASVLAVQALYNSYQGFEVERKVTLIPTTDANSKLAEQDAKLGRYGWADREKGKVFVPIERAIRLTAGEYRNESATKSIETDSNQGTLQ